VSGVGEDVAVARPHWRVLGELVGLDEQTVTGAIAVNGKERGLMADLMRRRACDGDRHPGEDENEKEQTRDEAALHENECRTGM